MIDHGFVSIVELFAVLFSPPVGASYHEGADQGPDGTDTCREQQCRVLEAPAGRETVLHRRVRRLFCILADCVRRIFAEQIDGVTVRHGRFSPLARQGMEAVALALGGRAGARLAGRLGPFVGRMTLLRLIRACPSHLFPAVTVLGVDDFARRRGHTHGATATRVC